MSELSLFETGTPAAPACDSPGAAADPTRLAYLSEPTREEWLASIRAERYTPAEVVAFVIAATDHDEVTFAATIWRVMEWGRSTDVKEFYRGVEPPLLYGSRLPWTWAELLDAKRQELGPVPPRLRGGA